MWFSVLRQVTGGVFCDQRSVQPGQRKVRGVGVHLQPLCSLCLCRIGKMSFSLVWLAQA